MPAKFTKILFSSLIFSLLALEAEEKIYGISGNPGAVNVLTGTGELGNLLQIPDSSGVRLGGLWMGDYNALLCGVDGRRLTGNSLFLLDLNTNLGKAIGWKGAYFGTEFLQFNGQPTNEDAGSVQGYNAITGSPPLNRSELYQLWLRQELFDKKLGIRIGKVVPTFHFNNVSKPLPTSDPNVFIPSVSGLIYTPIFVNTTMDGALGGYYNSVYGVITTIAPIVEAYVNLGFFDGNLARGKQTGLRGPHFNGYYFSIVEAGYGWAKSKPGLAAIGGWYQSGKFTTSSEKQNGFGGVYSFGSQALWIEEKKEEKEKKLPSANISAFYQLGWSNSKSLPMDMYAGMGLTGFSLIPKRPYDSFGMGIAWSRLNSRLFTRRSEVMLQGYYQTQILNYLYFEPVLSYIPYPGAHPDKYNVVALTARMTLLF